MIRCVTEMIIKALCNTKLNIPQPNAELKQEDGRCATEEPSGGARDSAAAAGSFKQMPAQPATNKQ